MRCRQREYPELIVSFISNYLYYLTVFYIRFFIFYILCSTANPYSNSNIFIRIQIFLCSFTKFIRIQVFLFEFKYFYSISNIILLFSNFLFEFKHFCAVWQVFILSKVFCLNALVKRKWGKHSVTQLWWETVRPCSYTS